MAEGPPLARTLSDRHGVAVGLGLRGQRCGRRAALLVDSPYRLLCPDELSPPAVFHRRDCQPAGRDEPCQPSIALLVRLNDSLNQSWNLNEVLEPSDLDAQLS